MNEEESLGERIKNTIYKLREQFFKNHNTAPTTVVLWTEYYKQLEKEDKKDKHIVRKTTKYYNIIRIYGLDIVSTPRSGIIEIY